MKFGEQMNINRKLPMTVKADKLIVLLEKKFQRKFEKKQLLAMFSRLIKLRFGQLKKVTELEEQVNNYLKEIAVNPRSAYRWVHTTLLPGEYLDQVKHKQLTHARAEVIYSNSEKKRRANIGLEIIGLGREIAERCLQ